MLPQYEGKLAKLSGCLAAAEQWHGLVDIQKTPSQKNNTSVQTVSAPLCVWSLSVATGRRRCTRLCRHNRAAD